MPIYIFILWRVQIDYSLDGLITLIMQLISMFCVDETRSLTKKKERHHSVSSEHDTSMMEEDFFVCRLLNEHLFSHW